MLLAPLPRESVGLRGFMALAVVLTHTSHSISYILAAMHVRPETFFLLSGYALMATSANDFHTPSIEATRRFFWLRFVRIWPMLLLSSPFMAVYAAIEQGGAAVGGNNLLGYWLLFGWSQDCRNEICNVPLWSLRAEAFAYFLFPALACVFLRFPKRWAAVSCALFALADAGYLFGTNFPIYGPASVIRAVLPFAGGCCLALSMSGFRRGWSDPTLLLVGVSFMVMIKLGIDVSFGALLLPLVVAAISVPGRITQLAFGNPAAQALGRVSYPVFVLHWPILRIVQAKLSGYSLSATVILTVALTYAAGLLLECYGERPLRQALRNWHIPRARRFIVRG